MFSTFHVLAHFPPLMHGSDRRLVYLPGYDNLSNENGEPNYDPGDKGRINFVATFILSRVDDSYKRSLCDLTLPSEMIEKIREIRFPNLMSIYVYSLRFQNRQHRSVKRSFAVHYNKWMNILNYFTYIQLCHILEIL